MSDEVKRNEIDTFAQWTQTDYIIDIRLPDKGVTLIGMNTETDRVEGEKEILRTELLFRSSDFETTGKLYQEIPIGEDMDSVSVHVNQNLVGKCFEFDWIKNEVRPSGVDMMGNSPNGTVLGFSGRPTSSDTIIIPPLRNMWRAEIRFAGNASLNQYTTERDLCFVNSFRVNVVPNDGYHFNDSISIDNFTFLPEEMKEFMKVEKQSDGSVNIELKEDPQNVNPKELSDVVITVPAAERSTYRVEIALGPNMTSSGGELVQNVVIGQPMTQINLVATNGMTFFPNIHNKSENGISINVDTSSGVPYTKAWVSGTPLRDTSIVIADVIQTVNVKWIEMNDLYYKCIDNVPGDYTVVVGQPWPSNWGWRVMDGFDFKWLRDTPKKIMESYGNMMQLTLTDDAKNITFTGNVNIDADVAFGDTLTHYPQPINDVALFTPGKKSDADIYGYKLNEYGEWDNFNVRDDFILTELYASGNTFYVTIQRDASKIYPPTFELHIRPDSEPPEMDITGSYPSYFYCYMNKEEETNNLVKYRAGEDKANEMRNMISNEVGNQMCVIPIFFATSVKPVMGGGIKTVQS